MAIKICSGTKTFLRSREVAILSDIRETGQGKAGFEQVLKILDNFTIKGPNGFHECLVTEVLVSLNDHDVRWQCSVDSARQIIQGFAFLHGQGISHGGMQPIIQSHGTAGIRSSIY